MSDADMARMYEEQVRADARVPEEARCALRGITEVLHRSGGGAFDDHTVSYIKCNESHECQKFYVVTDYASGRCDIRAMTESEVAKYA